MDYIGSLVDYIGSLIQSKVINSLSNDFTKTNKNDMKAFESFTS